MRTHTICKNLELLRFLRVWPFKIICNIKHIYREQQQLPESTTSIWSSNNKINNDGITTATATTANSISNNKEIDKKKNNKDSKNNNSNQQHDNSDKDRNKIIKSLQSLRLNSKKFALPSSSFLTYGCVNALLERFLLFNLPNERVEGRGVRAFKVELRRYAEK